MSVVASTFRWLQRKRYQYEVTFSLYMLTPIEKFIFNSVIFIIFSMVIIAACLYLPQHISFITDRAWFYYHGEDSTAATNKLGPVRALDRVVLETANAAMGMLESGAGDATREL